MGQKVPDISGEEASFLAIQGLCLRALSMASKIRTNVREHENSTVGIVLCKKKNTALVEITLPKDANIHAREYQLYLPSKEELQQKLAEWIKEQADIGE
jgi:hypothetical protein